MQFKKSPKTIAEQILLLKARGLKIENEESAAHHLSNISYYRLSAYFLSFQKYNDPTHTYMPWATFNRVVRLYVFDRELRNILLDAIERIEVALRCRIVYEYCHKYGNNWYEDSSLFLGNHNRFMELLNNELKKSKEHFVQHYFKKYTTPPNPPAWMAMEVLSFGQLSTMFKNLKTDDPKKAIAGYFGISHSILESWMEHLVYIRNLCAHHCRLWNRIVTVKATVPHVTKNAWINIAPIKNDKIYTTICIISYLLKSVTKNPPFYGKIKTLLHRFNEVDINASGFPINWLEDIFWKGTHVPVTYKIRVIVFGTKNLLKRQIEGISGYVQRKVYK
jgi:abortive infection bacteriophage resistance protein